MRKIILFLLTTLIFVSCQGPVGPEGPQGYGTNWKIINLTTNSSDWTEKTDNAGLNRFYTCHFSMPEITTFVYSSGSVLGYYIDNVNGVQQSLPYVRHYQNAANVLWTRTVDFDYSVGGVNVYVTNSDFAIDPPQVMNFRVVLMW
ncbi:MAG: hypothetical protein WCK78_13575 [Paludibacter sp.]